LLSNGAPQAGFARGLRYELKCKTSYEKTNALNKIKQTTGTPMLKDESVSFS